VVQVTEKKMIEKDYDEDNNMRSKTRRRDNVRRQESKQKDKNN
jgi:hypothetical protein